MSKRLILIVCGLALIIGLYLWDRDNSTVELMAGTVVKMEQNELNMGPDQWVITAMTAAGDEVELSNTETEPRFDAGDSICVEKITRKSMPVEYRRATNKTDC